LDGGVLSGVLVEIRLALPSLNSWAQAAKLMRLIQQPVEKDDPSEATKAISCYGLYVPELEKMWLRLVDGRPVSGLTTRFLRWCCKKLEVEGKRGFGFWSGTTPAGTFPKRLGSGSLPTIGGSKQAAVG
jgi:hypothetical protein